MKKKTSFQPADTGLEIRELPHKVREDGYPSMYPHIELSDSEFDSMEARLRKAITGIGSSKLDEHSVPELLLKRLGADEESVLHDLVDKRYKEAQRINEATKRAAMAKRIRLKKKLDSLLGTKHDGVMDTQHSMSLEHPASEFAQEEGSGLGRLRSRRRKAA